MDTPTAMNIPVGAVLKEVGYYVPEYGTKGTGFGTYIEALSHAITRTQAAVIRHKDHYAHLGERFVPLPEHITIDVRWIMDYPHVEGGGISGLDTVVARDRYANLDEARAALDRRKRYHP